jgi:hypothetical protein
LLIRTSWRVRMPNRRSVGRRTLARISMRFRGQARLVSRIDLSQQWALRSARRLWYRRMRG